MSNATDLTSNQRLILSARALADEAAGTEDTINQDAFAMIRDLADRLEQADRAVIGTAAALSLSVQTVWTSWRRCSALAKDVPIAGAINIGNIQALTAIMIEKIGALQSSVAVTPVIPGASSPPPRFAIKYTLQRTRDDGATENTMHRIAVSPDPANLEPRVSFEIMHVDSLGEPTWAREDPYRVAVPALLSRLFRLIESTYVKHQMTGGIGVAITTSQFGVPTLDVGVVAITSRYSKTEVE